MHAGNAILVADKGTFVSDTSFLNRTKMFTLIDKVSFPNCLNISLFVSFWLWFQWEDFLIIPLMNSCVGLTSYSYKRDIFCINFCISQDHSAHSALVWCNSWHFQRSVEIEIITTTKSSLRYKIMLYMSLEFIYLKQAFPWRVGKAPWTSSSFILRKSEARRLQITKRNCIQFYIPLWLRKAAICTKRDKTKANFVAKVHFQNALFIG